MRYDIHTPLIKGGTQGWEAGTYRHNIQGFGALKIYLKEDHLTDRMEMI